MFLFVIVVTRDLIYVFFHSVVTDIRPLLTLVAGVESRLTLYYFFFLSFLALLEGPKSWVGVGTEALALDLSLQ